MDAKRIATVSVSSQNKMEKSNDSKRNDAYYHGRADRDDNLLQQEVVMDDLISRQAAIDAFYQYPNVNWATLDVMEKINELPSAQPERLTDDDFETIRIHLNAYKETLCNQRRWKEAEEYQRIIDRFMSFASAQPEHGYTMEEFVYGQDMGNPEDGSL